MANNTSQEQAGAGQMGAIPTVTAREAWERINAPEGGAPALIDVREVWEYAEGHASGAVNIPLSQFRERSGEVPRDRQALFICHSGQRSMQAARFMRQQGMADVVNITGGTDAWESAGLPMERGAGV